MLWSQFDDTGFGELTPSRFRTAVYETDFRTKVRHLAGQEALNRLERRTVDEGKPVTYQEFVDLVGLGAFFFGCEDYLVLGM